MHRLTEGPRSHLTEHEVVQSLSFREGARVRHGLLVLNYDGSVTDPQPNLNVESWSVDWSLGTSTSVTSPATEKAAVRRTGRASFVDVDKSFNPLAHMYQPWIEMLAPTGRWVRWEMGVFVSPMPNSQDNGTHVTYSLDLADKCHLWASEFLTDPVQVPDGTNVLMYIAADLDSRFSETDLDFPTASPLLERGLVFDTNTSILEMYNVLLEAVGYDHLTVMPDGKPYTRLAEQWLSKPVQWSYEPGGTMLTESQLQALLPELPNVVTFAASRGPNLAHEGWGLHTVYNHTVGPGSIQERGREVRHRIEVEAQDQTELERVAKSEAQRIFAGGGLRFSGTIALNPSHDDRDVVRLIKPRLGLLSDTRWAVTNWSMSVTADTPPSTMNIQAEQIVEVD